MDYRTGIISLTLVSLSLQARIEEDVITREIGNLSLSSSQQPAPLFGFGFGQNIVDQYDTLLYLYPSFIRGCNKAYNEIIPTFLYGIRDDLSLFMQLPIAAQFRYNNNCSSGIEDLLMQLEYACYENEETYNEITVLANMTVPTGSRKKNPATGFGTVSFFFGLTASHSGPEWYLWASGGAVFPLTHNHLKTGNQFPYNIGIGKNIAYKSKEWIIAILLEFDGEFRQRNEAYGNVLPNSGGHELFIGPSLWFSTEHLTLQGGIAWIASQQLNGIQNKDQYTVACTIGWKFN